VPDYEWTGAAGTIGKDLWNTSAAIDARWDELVSNVTRVYPSVRSMGFEGLVCVALLLFPILLVKCA
jgi:hypothetical protein